MLRYGRYPLGWQQFGNRGLVQAFGARSQGQGARPFKATGLPLWTAAVQAVQAGTRNAKLLAIGDSTTAGVGSNGSALGNNAKAFGWPTKLAAALSPLPASWQSFCANSNIASNNATLNALDNRMSITGAGVGITGATIGAVFWSLASTGTLNFAPTIPVDTFEIYTAQNTGIGTLTVAFNGGAVAQSIVGGTTPAAVKKTVVTTTLGMNTLNIGRSSGTGYVMGVVAYNSAAKEISILNGGWSAGKVADIITAANPWDPLNMISAYAPDLTIICLDINDWNAGTNQATRITNLGTIITRAKQTGDVLLMTGAPSNPSGGYASYVTQQAYIADDITAIGNGGLQPIIDAWQSVFGGAWNASLMFDDLHPNGGAYTSIAALVKNRITT